MTDIEPYYPLVVDEEIGVSVHVHSIVLRLVVRGGDRTWIWSCSPADYSPRYLLLHICVGKINRSIRDRMRSDAPSYAPLTWSSVLNQFPPSLAPYRLRIPPIRLK